MSARLKAPASREECLAAMARTSSVELQLQLRKELPPETYYADIAELYITNPFFPLTDDEFAYFTRTARQGHASSLLISREAARRSTTPRYGVFCMPKSGSSFVTTALQAALQLRKVSLTGVGREQVHSTLGMNSREQEVDEFALVKAILTSPAGFVSQTHTRYSMYLGLQISQFGVRPLVTVRNILDCIVSFDEMMRKERRGRRDDGWLVDAQFALPLDFQDRDDTARYDLLARSFGVWLIAFYLSWKRCARQSYVRPLWVRYEEHVLNTDRLLRLLSQGLNLRPDQFARLHDYLADPDRQRSRFNVGTAGRGRERVPEAAIEFLLSHARLFSAEISEDEVRYLIR